jgi:hypothetical protein|nr:hypothetical protein [Kofleriaceae bacterium]
MTRDDDDDVLSPGKLADYDVPRAPAGFADRVMAAIGDQPAGERAGVAAPAPARRSRGAIAALGGLAAVLAIALGASLLHGAGGSAGAMPAGEPHGAHVAAARESIALGARGIAVAEAGTQLRWDVDAAGAARVEQSTGSAFYRVERGGAFEVTTPLGVVTVTGTCFSVEVSMKPSKDSLRGAAIGAALATAVVVTVYEGGVSFARGGDHVRATAGDSVVSRADEPPQLHAGGASGSSGAPAIAAMELASARARVAELERQLSGSGSGAPAARDLHHRPTDDDASAYYAPTHDQLVDMAKDCVVAYDMPPFGGDHDDLVSADAASQAGLSDGDRDAIDSAYRAVDMRALGQLRALYVELTGIDPDAAAALSPNAIVDDIEAKSDAADAALARKRISAERAGLAPPPSGSELATHAIVERMLRIEANLGNDAEAAAAGVVGADRARALRAGAGTGWSGSAHSHGGC